MNLYWQCTGRKGASPGYCQVGGVVQKPWLPTRPLLTGMCACTLSHLVMSSSLQLHDCSLLGSFIMEFSNQEYLPCLPLDLPNPGIEPGSPTLQADSLPSEPLGKPSTDRRCLFFFCFFFFLRWLGFVFLDWPSPSHLARENGLFMGPLWSMGIDISGLLDSSAPFLGYRGGKKKTQATHGCVVPQFPTSLISLPSFPFLSESFLYFINHVWEEF